MARAFLIGAGATKAQYDNAPLSADFFKILMDTDPVLYEHIKDVIRSIPGGELSERNIEKLIVQADELPISNKNKFYECIYQAIYQLIAKQTDSTEKLMQQYLNPNKTYPPTLFKTLLDDHRLNDDDFFMTLNYDLYLDREIIKVHKKINYGIGDEMINLKNDFPISTLTPNAVYHLHGSLNWEMINQNRINLYHGARLPEYIRSNSNLCLVPPGRKELNPILKSIWQVATKKILDADELVVIGCSLNRMDHELINLVTGFSQNKDANKIKIVYMQSAKEAVNYNQILRGKFIDYPFGFVIEGPSNRAFTGAIEFIYEA
jgi:hypothetical protein